jgi:hypothetical protein
MECPVLSSRYWLTNNKNQTKPDSPQEKEIPFRFSSQNQKEKPNRIKTVGHFLNQRKSKSSSRSSNKIRRKVSDNLSGSLAQIFTQPIFPKELHETEISWEKTNHIQQRTL